MKSGRLCRALTIRCITAVHNVQLVAQIDSFVCVEGSVNNALCFLGPHRIYNDYSRTAFELVPGQGHFGPGGPASIRTRVRSVQPRTAPDPTYPIATDAIPGDARWRRGESVSQKVRSKKFTRSPKHPSNDARLCLVWTERARGDGGTRDDGPISCPVKRSSVAFGTR